MYIQHDVDICPCLILDGLCKIASQEGLSALWNGTAASIILASNPSIQFMVYETIKRYFQQFFKSKASTTISIYCSSCSIQSRFTSITWYLIHASYFLFSNKQELSGFLYFIIGAISKMVATVATYPLQILQSRFRVSLW